MNISIIVPFYNREKYLRDTLKSIQMQTYKNFQAILINDCSSDCSANIAKSFVDMDSRFILIKNNIRQRQGIAKNKGIEYVLNGGGL